MAPIREVGLSSELLADAGGVAGKPCHGPNPISAVAAALRAPLTVARLSDKSGIGTRIRKAYPRSLAVCVRLA